MLFNYFILIIFWVVIEYFYIKIAKKFSIIDRPNYRSSHNKITIRGGGIIFPLSAILFLPYTLTSNLIFLFALLEIAILSFIDDIKNISSILRLLFQSLAVIDLIYAKEISWPFVWLMVIFIVIIGIINAYNFMDGINGITVFYSLITVSSVFWVNTYVYELQPPLFFISIISALIAFAFFNARRKAICFAGDVGSVSIAFIICFLLLSLIYETKFIFWILFLSIYGIDTIFTFVCRIFRREGLMQAHRSHFYQHLVNEQKWSHIGVSVLYAAVQLILNILVIFSYNANQIWLPLTVLFVFLIIYIIFRFRLEGHERLFVSYNPD